MGWLDGRDYSRNGGDGRAVVFVLAPWIFLEPVSGPCRVYLVIRIHSQDRCVRATESKRASEGRAVRGAFAWGVLWLSTYDGISGPGML